MQNIFIEALNYFYTWNLQYIKNVDNKLQPS